VFKGAFSFSHFGKSGLARKSLANDITPAFIPFLQDPERVTYYSPPLKLDKLDSASGLQN